MNYIKSSFLVFFGLLLSVALAGCQEFPGSEKLDDSFLVSAESGSQQVYDCSSEDYYDSLIIDDVFPFVRNESDSTYRADVPELCAKFIAHPSTQSGSLGDMLHGQAQDGLSINNNTISVDFGGVRTINLYQFYNKDPNSTIDEAVQERFNIRPPHEYDGQRICYIGKVGNSVRPRAEITSSYLDVYQLYTMSDVLTPDEVEESTWGPFNSQLCGNDYPMLNIGFERLQSLYLLYNKKTHPAQYVLYKGNPAQDEILYTYMEIEFY